MKSLCHDVQALRDLAQRYRAMARRERSDLLREDDPGLHMTALQFEWAAREIERLREAKCRQRLQRVADILVEKAIHEEDCPFVMGDENGDGHVACECYLDAVFEQIGFPNLESA